jgi:hypothetical protein
MCSMHIVQINGRQAVEGETQRCSCKFRLMSAYLLAPYALGFIGMIRRGLVGVWVASELQSGVVESRWWPRRRPLPATMCCARLASSPAPGHRDKVCDLQNTLMLTSTHTTSSLLEIELKRRRPERQNSSSDYQIEMSDICMRPLLFRCPGRCVLPVRGVLGAAVQGG